MRKKLNKVMYRFLNKEVNHAVDRGIISTQQKDDMMAFYQEGYGLNFIRVLVSVGAILIGLGILLFVAGNWDAISNTVKVMIIITSLAASMFASYLNAEKRPFTARALLYLSILIFGAGIFLIEQTFSLNIGTNQAFFLWAIGALLLSSIYKDTILFLFAHGAAFIFIATSFNELIFLQGLFVLAAFYAGNFYFNYQKAITAASLAVTLMLIAYTLGYFEVNPFYGVALYLVLGFVFYYLKHDLNKEVFQWFGIVMIGVTGFTLSFKNIWQELGFIQNGSVYAIVFSLILIIYMFTLITRKQLIPLIIIGVLIMRFYFDTLYDFLPRALFFIIGGLLILGIGYYIERFRKGGSDDETVMEK